MSGVGPGGNGPAAVSIAPSDGPVAGGTTVTVFGSGLDSTVQFIGLAGAQTSIISRLGTAAVVVSASTFSSITGPALVIAPSLGVSQTGAGQLFTYNPTPVITSLAPTQGAFAGGTLITLRGTNLVPLSSNDAGLVIDVCSVPTSIVSQSSSEIIARTGAAVTAGLCTVSFVSPRVGSLSLPSAYTYNQQPSITASSHLSAPLAGGLLITFSGPVLGNGTDIGQVLIGGVQAPIISQSSTHVQVSTPALGSTGTKTVVVSSINYGDSTLAGGLFYNEGALSL